MSRAVKFKLRPHQYEAHLALERRRFNALVAHRRFGKTVLAVSRQVSKASKAKSSTFRSAYIAPLYRQAKAVAWDYAKFLAIPLGGIASETELHIKFPNGARYNLYGAEDPDKLRGQNLGDVVFDEVSQMPYRVWSEIVLPMLLANGGHALFIGTPQGKNALYEIWQRALHEPGLWGRQMYKASETGIFKPEDLKIARSEMTPEEYEQEFECSFTAAIKGAYYAHYLAQAEAQKRVGEFPLDEGLPMVTSWDLGMADSTAIWFIQPRPNGSFLWYDYYEAHGEGLEHYAKVLAKKDYYISQHIAPHDIRVRELGTGKSRLEISRDMGIRFDIAPNIPIADGINAMRSIMSKSYWNLPLVQVGYDSLMHYRRDFNDKMGMFKDKPLHDTTSHAADAARYFAVGHRGERKVPTQTKADSNYNPFGRR